MQTHDFTTTVLVDKSPEEVFNAVNQPQKWWSGTIKGKSAKLNDEFSYNYQEFHYSKQRVVEMIPNQKVVWLVTESGINYVDDINEWTGTKISFEITEKDGKTQLRFAHIGLVPQIECFDSCSSAWTQLIQQSLFTFITTGKSDKPVLV